MTALGAGGVRVRVIAAESGQAVVGALVGVDSRISDEAGGLFTGSTGQDGCCEFQGPSSQQGSRIVVAVRARGRRQLTFDEALSDWPAAGHLVRGGNVTEVEVRLVSGPALLGRVLDARGRGIPDAVIEPLLVGGDWLERLAVPAPGFTWPPPVITDSQGRFEWWSFEAGQTAAGEARLWFIAEHPDHAPALAELPRRSEDVPDEVVMVMDDGLTVSGTVLTQRGLPVPDAQVRIGGTRRPGEPWEFSKHVNCAAEGSYVCRGLRPGPHLVYVLLPSHHGGVHVLHESRLVLHEDAVLDLRIADSVAAEARAFDLQQRLTAGDGG